MAPPFKSPHSHIRSLGLDSANLPIKSTLHVVGQESAREALGIVVDLVRTNKFGGRMVVLNGPPSCGKTSAAIAMARELGEKIPFTFLTAWEIVHGCAAHSQAETIDRAVRKSVLVKIREVKDTFEGEVTDIGSGSMTLRSRKGTLTLSDVETKDVSVGDVVYVEGSVVKKIGKCESGYKENDLDALRYVPLPKGEVHRKREKISCVSLHDLDHFYSDRLRKEVDCIVERYVESGMAEIHLGVLFIDEAQILDSLSMAYLNKVCEATGPLIVLASNAPATFADRAVVVKMENLGESEIREIVKMRMTEEEVDFDVGDLVNVCMNGGLRYGLSLLRVMKVMGTTDVHDAVDLFSSYK